MLQVGAQPGSRSGTPASTSSSNKIFNTCSPAASLLGKQPERLSPEQRGAVCAGRPAWGWGAGAGAVVRSGDWLCTLFARRRRVQTRRASHPCRAEWGPRPTAPHGNDSDTPAGLPRWKGMEPDQGAGTRWGGERKGGAVEDGGGRAKRGKGQSDASQGPSPNPPRDPGA